jgi:hypothetical protein
LLRKAPSSTVSDLQALLLNSNSLENNLNSSVLSQFSKKQILLHKTSTRFFFKNKTTSSLIRKQNNLKVIKNKIKNKISNLFQFVKTLHLSQRNTLIKPVSTPTTFNSNITLDLFFKNTNLLSYVFTNSLLFKYLFSSTATQLQISSPVLILNLSNNLFPTKHSLFTKSNIVTFHSFNYKLKRRVLKAFTYDTFSPNVTM